MSSRPSSPSLSRRTFLLGVGAGAVVGLGTTSPAAATSTDTWEQLWELPAESPQQTPAVSDETVYVPAGGVVRSVDAETGDASWVQTVGDPIVRDGLLASDGRVYAATGSGTVTCLDATDGEPVWSETVEASVHGVAVSADRLVVQTPDAVHCLDARDGTENWRTPIDAGSATSRPVRPVTDGATLVGSAGTTVFALALDSGAVQWTDRRPTDDAARCLGIRDDAVVVGGERTTAMLTLDAAESLWTRQSGSDHLATGTDSSIYAMGVDGSVAIDPASGRTELEIDVRTGPNGGIAVGEIEPHGVSVTLSGQTDGTPTVAVLAAAAGTRHWELTADAPGTGYGTAVIADERLVVQDHDRAVTVAYGEPADEAAPNDAAMPTPDDAGLGLDTTIGVVSLVVTVLAGIVAVAQYRLDRKNGPD